MRPYKRPIRTPPPSTHPIDKAAVDAVLEDPYAPDMVAMEWLKIFDPPSRWLNQEKSGGIEQQARLVRIIDALYDTYQKLLEIGYTYKDASDMALWYFLKYE